MCINRATSSLTNCNKIISTSSVNEISTSSVNEISTSSVNEISTSSVNEISTSSVNEISTSPVSEISTSLMNEVFTSSVDQVSSSLVNIVSTLITPTSCLQPSDYNRENSQVPLSWPIGVGLLLFTNFTTIIMLIISCLLLLRYKGRHQKL